MSAMHQQAHFLGMEPPAVADVDVKVAVWGRLARHAELRTRTDGSEVLTVLIEQHLQRHPLAKPLLAVRVYHDPDAPHITHQLAHHAAQRLRAGLEVVVLGRGLEQALHDGEPVLRFVHVDGIKPADELQRAMDTGGTEP